MENTEDRNMKTSGQTVPFKFEEWSLRPQSEFPTQ
jgi:hypothetical protein